MFYGYDLSVDMVSSTPANVTAANEEANTTMVSNATAEETTTSKDVETTTELPTTTTAAAAAADVTTTTPTTTTTEEATTATEAETTSTEAAAATESGEAAGEDEAAELVSAFVAEEEAEPFLRIQKARVSRLPTSKLQAPLKHSNPITPKPSYLPSARVAVMPMMARQMTAPLPRRTATTTTTAPFPTPTPPSSTASSSRKAKMARHKRHVVGYKDLDANLLWHCSVHMAHMVLHIRCPCHPQLDLPTSTTTLSHITSTMASRPRPTTTRM